MSSGIRINLLFCILLFYSFPAFSQILSKKQFIKAVQAADISFYYDEDFDKAASQYKHLLDIYPENQNLSAKLGICYLNLDGKKTEALKLLEKASGNIVSKEADYVEFGEKAPLDTYMYLAIAYHQNDSLLKAIKLYKNAKSKLAATSLFRNDYFDKQIKDCNYALAMEKHPKSVSDKLYSDWLTEYPGAQNPVISKNDSVFVFTVNHEGKTRIFCSYKNTKWNKPTDITPQLGKINGLYTNSITGDGKMMIVYLNDGGDGNLYYSIRKDSTWSRIRSLGGEINSIYWESHGFITPDGKTLYFTSNRPGGFGELDIWTSEKDNEKKWKQPVNCGRVINTAYDETTPFFDPPSNSLLFSSEGLTSMGGYDVFRSERKKGTWTKPLGFPYTMNTTTENIFISQGENQFSFVTSLYNSKTGIRNIYYLELEDTLTSTSLHAEGTISLQDGIAVDPVLAKIQLYDQKTGILLKNITVSDSGSFKYVMKPGNFKVLITRVGDHSEKINLNIKKEQQTAQKSTYADTASFQFEVKPGDYQLFINYAGYKTDTINLSIPNRFPGSLISINSSLIPDQVFRGDFISIKNILFDFNSFSLNEKAILILGSLRSILLNNPELKVEVAGYTDSKGSAEFNAKLADNRAQTIIDYLSKSGISSARFIKKSFGKSNFIATNTNPDGSDNPEGRKFNRRVTFGIINPKTGIIIRQETFVPERLSNPSAIRYSIVLLKSQESKPADYFANLKIEEFQFIRKAMDDAHYVYLLGVFYSRAEASEYLLTAREKGFREAYIVTQYDINSYSWKFDDREETMSSYVSEKTYTIQLSASKKPLDMKQFEVIEGVKEIHYEDGYYRYILGEYESVAEAKKSLLRVKESGFSTAFIKELKTTESK
jgi:outer membrane protein OmpA-like peptidoglycan-associated protein